MTDPDAEVFAESWMRYALVLARRGRYSVSPNPMVGAVVVRDGQLVGEGFHLRAGEPHAEIHALRAAGERAQGADMYVTLEPCCHTGRTGPCSEAVIRAGIRRVFVGAIDPNPRVAGGGVGRLREAGVEVVTGLLGPECERLNASFNRWITSRRPFVTLKLATSLDGRIAAATGASQWITSPEARARGHALRASHDAILVGSGTALADDPRLTARDVEPLCREAGPPSDPLRVIVDSQLRVPHTAKAFADANALVVTARDASLVAVNGFEVWSLPDDNGRVDLVRLLERLGEREPSPITSLLVEGGGKIAASVLSAGLVDQLRLYLAPSFMGGDGLAAVAGIGVNHPDEAPRFAIDSIERIGPDVEVTAHALRL